MGFNSGFKGLKCKFKKVHGRAWGGRGGGGGGEDDVANPGGRVQGQQNKY